ncbi:hypothetical protein Sru01_03510 [Sphaerisporangium rufum]|uniref:Uncharacterized protein n=1 Tax=Sphaerisporangium rufum TaxID=1381558 RepID=A0A919QWF0_9ACTN|nr:Rv3235 family protein [Sphaerisporangium rufum]GII75369.1 hypothetical protein Sru01_03510 [Sphaerisporangium rufum]
MPSAPRPARPARTTAPPRLRAVPPADPPYDDDRHAPARPAAPAAPAAAAVPVRRAAPIRPVPAFHGGRAAPDERGLQSLGQAMAEVLAGRRPPGTLAGRLTDRAYQELVRAGRMINATRPPVAGLPHVDRPRDGAVEACVLVRCGERGHVLAIRLERRGTQWLCTDFETA